MREKQGIHQGNESTHTHQKGLESLKKKKEQEKREIIKRRFAGGRKGERTNRQPSIQRAGKCLQRGGIPNAKGVPPVGIEQNAGVSKDHHKKKRLSVDCASGFLKNSEKKRIQGNGGGSAP